MEYLTSRNHLIVLILTYIQLRNYISPVLVCEDAAKLFSFDDIQSLGEYLANVWFGIQYELSNCPEEIRVIKQRGPIDPEGDYHKHIGIIHIKKTIPIDKHGNEIRYETRESGRVFTMPAWNVRGHKRQLKDGREVAVRPYSKGKERNNPNAINSKQYVFDEEKIDEDATND